MFKKNLVVALVCGLALTARSGTSLCSADVIPTTGLQAWLNADAITGVADGGAVSTWANSASTGVTYDATASGTAQPLWYSSAINGKPALKFDGADDWMLMGSTPMHSQTAFTMFAVVRTSIAGSEAAGNTIVGNTDYVSSVLTGMALYAWGTYGDETNLLNLHAFQYRNGTGGGIQSINGTPVNSVLYNQAQIVGAKWTTGETTPLSLYLDGVQQDLTPWAYGVSSSQAWLGTDPGLGIGVKSTSWDSGLFFNGDIAELIFYNGTLSNSDRSLVTNYLGDKYGIVVPPPTSGLDGDYNNDGAVDAADYVSWRKNVGQPLGTLPNDSTGVDPIGDAQYTQWQANFGNPPGGGGTAVVPEPTCLLQVALAACAMALSFSRARFQRRSIERRGVVEQFAFFHDSRTPRAL